MSKHIIFSSTVEYATRLVASVEEGLVNVPPMTVRLCRDFLEQTEELDRAEKSHTRRFTMYRRNVPTETHNADQQNAPDEPQFEGVVFSDGRVVVRWLTAKRSVSVWDCLEDMMAIHGHPEYESELVWHDRTP